MIITRTPLRISFFGGGTDYPQWFNHHEGAVLVTTINKYCYVTLHNGSSWYTFDLHNRSGLATSSAYTVGLLRACTQLDNLTISKLATTWEQDKTNGTVGSQDQYICAMGGFRLLRFSVHGIRDKWIDPAVVNPLQDYLMLFDTHQYRQTMDIVAHQLDNIKDNQELLNQMVDMVDAGYSMLQKADYNGFGNLLREAWVLKRQLSDDVSTPAIDAIYQAAITAGARGGKLLGGGGGGFIVFFVEKDRQASVRQALSDLTCVPFQFETRGSQVIFRDGADA